MNLLEAFGRDPRRIGMPRELRLPPPSPMSPMMADKAAMPQQQQPQPMAPMAQAMPGTPQAMAAPQAQPRPQMSPEELSRVLGAGAAAIGQFAGPGGGGVQNTGAAIAALAGGMGLGRQQYAQEQTDKEVMDFQRQQIERKAAMEEQEAAKAAQENEAQAQFLATLDPETRQLLAAYPELAKDMFKPKEQKLSLQTITDGAEQRQVLMDMASGRVVEELGRAPRWQDKAPERPQVFGSGETGYYTLGPDGQPRQLVAGQDPGTAGATTALKTRAGQIEDAMAQFGVDQAQATKLVDGLMRINTDPVSGISTIVDLVSGEARPIAEPRQTVTSTQEPPDRSLYDMAGNVAGVAPALAEAGSAVTGQVGGPVAEQIIEDRQMIRSTQNELIRALSINPRYPVGEIERLTKEINIAPRVWDSPEGLRARMRSVDEYLERRATNELNAANNTNLPRQTRQDAAAAAEAINNYRTMLGASAERLVGTAAQIPPSAGTTSSGVGWEIVE